MRQGRDRTGGRHGTLVISYLALRRALGVLGVGFPLVLAAGAFVLFGSGLQGSLSAYYHTGMRDVFVGILFAMALFLYAYQGYERRDDLAGDLACLFALGVALFPTTPASALPESVDWFGRAHILCAALFFLTLAYFSLFLFTKAAAGIEPTREKRLRNRVYRVCGYTMLACIGLIGAYFALVEGRLPALEALRPVFWLESVAVMAFGVSWLVKGEAILADRETAAAYAYAWGYRVQVGREDAFRRLYGPQGDWVALFCRAAGYRYTDLLQDREQSDRFMTVDHWDSREHYLAFRRDFADEFAALDARGEELTTGEVELGEFTVRGEETA